MNELEQLRQQIDAIDRQLLLLFLERMQVCSRVADYKRKIGMPVLDAEREKRVLADKLKLLREPGMEAEVYEFFNAVMSISRVRQTRELTGSLSAPGCLWKSPGCAISEARAPTAKRRRLGISAARPGGFMPRPLRTLF